MSDSTQRMIEDLYKSIDVDPHLGCSDGDVAHIEVNQNKVLGAHLVPGLSVEPTELPDGIEITLTVSKGCVIEKPVRVCFGMLPESGVQRIVMHTHIEDDAKISLLAYCTFPNAVDVQHLMDADIHIGKNAEYSYFERHVHGESGGVNVVPKAVVHVDEGGRFKTEFELLKGRVGRMDINYEAYCKAHATIDMKARVSARATDYLRINEIGHLQGDYSRGALVSHIALRDDASAQIDSTLTASGSYARGHVDCKEIVQGNATAVAIPVVKVMNPKAHVTHEAAIGSVDDKQLQTLMARGLSEDEAVDLIIDGLLA